MAFAVPQPFSKRLKVMEPNGNEIREGWDPMDMSYMQLLDAAGPTEDAPAKTEEAPPDPGEVIKVFEDAKGNLDILVDVVTNLERSFLEAKPFTAGRRPGIRREDAVANSLHSRVAATSANLARVSSRLAAGAELLQAHVDREDRFYCQLRQLQMFWKVHLNPRVIDCPFMVDLSLPEPSAAVMGGAAAAAAAAAAATGGGGAEGAACGGGAAAAAAAAAASSVAAGQALTGNTYELGSGSLLVPLMKDDSGALRVQLELPEGRPNVNDPERVGGTRLNGKGARTQLVVGARRVHALLLQLHRRQLWRQVAAGLERDAAGLGLGPPPSAAAGAGAGPAGTAGGGAAGALSGGGHPVHVSLARLASQNVLRTSDPSLAALRPLMLEHLLACRLPPPYKPPPPRPAAATGSGLGARLSLPAGGGGGGGPYGGGALSQLPLLPDLAALLNQMVFRDHQLYHLDLEAHALPYVSLRWRPCCTSMLTSAMEIRVGPSHRVLLLVRDGRTDVEGVVQATGAAAGSGSGGSRWVRDTHMGFSRHDVPCVLRSVLQTLGMPLDRLLGVSVPAQHAPHAAPHGLHGTHGSLGNLLPSNSHPPSHGGGLNHHHHHHHHNHHHHQRDPHNQQQQQQQQHSHHPHPQGYPGLSSPDPGPQPQLHPQGNAQQVGAQPPQLQQPQQSQQQPAAVPVALAGGQPIIAAAGGPETVAQPPPLQSLQPPPPQQHSKMQQPVSAVAGVSGSPTGMQWEQQPQQPQQQQPQPQSQALHPPRPQQPNHQLQQSQYYDQQQQQQHQQQQHQQQQQQLLMAQQQQHLLQQQQYASQAQRQSLLQSQASGGLQAQQQQQQQLMQQQQQPPQQQQQQPMQHPQFAQHHLPQHLTHHYQQQQQQQLYQQQHMQQQQQQAGMGAATGVAPGRGRGVPGGGWLQG